MKQNMKKVLKQIVPPIFFAIARKVNGSASLAGTKVVKLKDSSKQELDIYWTDDMAYQLENWGKAHTWNEIECLLVTCRGKVLDIACGTGVNILSMQRFKGIDIHGFDISDFLIKKA